MLPVNEGNLSGQVDFLIGKYAHGWVNQINRADFYTQMINSCEGGATVQSRPSECACTQSATWLSGWRELWLSDITDCRLGQDYIKLHEPISKRLIFDGRRKCDCVMMLNQGASSTVHKYPSWFLPKQHFSFLPWSPAGRGPGEATNHWSPGSSCSITELKVL